MKTLLSVLLALAFVPAVNSQSLFGGTNELTAPMPTTPPAPASSIWTALENGIKTIGSEMPSNFVVAGYGEYAPNAPTKWGGGGAVFWNISQNIGAGFGLDWLGHWTQVNANLELKVPITPLAFLGSSFTNFWVTPWALAGLGLPIAGTSIAGDTSSVISIVGAGANIDIVKVLGGKLTIGGGLIDWEGAGAFSGKRYIAELAYTRGL